MEENYYIDINCQLKNHAEERVCGDVFLSKRIREEDRIVVVLSDGLGHGIKANLLATLTATLASSFIEEHKSVQKIAESLINTLPVDEDKGLNYSTFTIVDIYPGGEIIILEYENPPTLIFRGSKRIEPAWNCVLLEGDRHSGKEVLTATLHACKGDRIVFCTDGVVQSGLGGERYQLGWGIGDLESYVSDSIHEDQAMSSYKLASKVINKANQNDNFHAKDDISCAVIYFRDPRKLMICTGPPEDVSKDGEYAAMLKEFSGKKVICGATTVDIIARELELKVIDHPVIFDTDLPPASMMEGVDLVTEGILTLSKVNELLKSYNHNYKFSRGPADQIVKMILGSDEIQFIVGTKINVAHQDPSLPVELELRRTVVHRITRVLEEKFLKKVSMKFY
ncbi:MAG: SpoIIE family protein phosphatase [Bacteroidota bacterium]